MKIVRNLLLVAFLALALSGCYRLRGNRDVLFQVSTIDTLLAGVYDGELTCRKLKKQGDFGIGTFNALDGEMIGLRGKFYQIKADGVAYPAGNSLRTPFATVTFFEPDKSVLLDRTLNYEELQGYLDQLLPTKNIFYAIKIEGLFKYIKARSVPRQVQPYPLLVEVVKNQTVFEFHDVKGTVVGFRCPAYMEGINVPGYHFHFITEDKKAGGHLLDCQAHKVGIEIDNTSEFYLALPRSGAFYRTDLTREKQGELQKVEKE